eukprot:7193763-Ditylum_brightwellii.AAC.1
MLREAGLDPDKPDTIGNEDREEAKRDTKEAYLAWVFLSNANKVKFVPLLRDLANSHLQGNDKYPRTITAAHKLLVGWEGGTYSIPGPSNNGIAYTTVGDDPEEDKTNAEGTVLANKGKGKERVIHTRRGDLIKCYLCGGNHFSNMCPKKGDKEVEKDKKTGPTGHTH